MLLTRTRDRTIPAPEGTLLRVLGVAFGIAVSVGSSIGSGILRVPGEVAAHLPSTGLFLGAWILGGCYALLGTLSLAELGTMLPRAGGGYLYARRAFGPYAAFVVGWSGWFGSCASIAAVAMILGDYLGGFFPALAKQALLTALAGLLPFLFLHWRGVHWGSGAQQFTSLLKLLGFTALVVTCFAVRGTRPPIAAEPGSAPSGLGLFIPLMLALQGIIFTYGGWAAPVGFAEEMRDPGRDLPRSMLSGVFLVIAVYLLVNLALLHVLPLSRIAGQKLAVGTASEAVFGIRGEQIIRGLAVLSILGVQNAGLLGTPRLLLAMSRDGLAPVHAGMVNLGGTPTVALLATMATATFFLGTGTFQTVLAAVVLFGVAIDGICFLSVFELRRREPKLPRPYRVWGYPWTTGLALLAAGALVIGVAVSTPQSGLYALLLLAVSYPAFRWVDAQTKAGGVPAAFWRRR